MNIRKSKEKVSVSVRMPAELYNMLKILSVAESRSLSGQIVYALNEWAEAKKALEQSKRNWDIAGFMEGE